MLEDYSLAEAKYYELIHVHIHLRSKNISPQKRCYIKFFWYRFDLYLRIM